MYITVSCLFVLLTRGINGQIFGGALPPKVDILKTKIDTNWFNQTLDHFSKDTPTYWKQRYFVNTDVWTRNSSSPVFLMLGERNINESWMRGGAWVNWANRYGALLFQLEHRYYGQSHPTPDTSVDNLQYLTSEQAIEDIRNFIQSMNVQYNLTSGNKWILFGGSYPGALVAWARLKLPNLVYGGVSSSAPLQAVVDFYRYDELARDSLEKYYLGCGRELSSAIESIQKMFKSSQGTQTIIQKFNICKGFNASYPKDLNVFYQSVYLPIARAVQYNGGGTDKEKITYVCGKFISNSTITDRVDRLAMLRNDTSKDCLNANYKASISNYKNTGWNSNAVAMNTRQWVFQTCNEFGFYQTSGYYFDLLRDTLPIAFFTQQCTDIYGSNFNPIQLDDAVKKTNNDYGGTKIVVDRVVFVQGSVDPWHELGMVRSREKSPLIYIQDASHCQDMGTPQKRDSIFLKRARDQIQKSLDSWIIV